MRILIAPNAFKGSISAYNAAKAIEEGIRRVVPDAECILLPIADGGDGTAEVLVHGTGGRFINAKVLNPLGRSISTTFALLSDGTTAMIEMANASGLRLISSEERNPLRTTTYGTGQLIKAALNVGARKIIIGLGGSATVDGGAGMAQALGARLLDTQGDDITYGGGSLSDLHAIDISGLDPRLRECEIIAACDVDNPLVGENGSAAIFGPQKGATPDMVTQLDANLAHLAQIIQRDLGVDVLTIPGGGAAGGIAAGLIAFCGARLYPGTDLVLDTLELDHYVQGVDLVITGEGRIDGQTAHGKAPVGVAARAKRYGIPVVALAGGIGDGAEALYAHGIDVIMPIVARPMLLEDAMRDAAILLADASERLMRAMGLKG
jgi:glycerate 2-kinase